MSKIFLLLFFLHVLLQGKITNAGHSYAGVRRLPFDIFINHRGPDVKNTLASHIYHNLHLIGHTPFLDKCSIRIGEKASAAIQNAMQTALVFVAIFSPRYSESEWCMGELQFIVESGKPIIPVFYKVSPSELLMEAAHGLYVQAFQEHAISGKVDSGTLQKWQEAFREVSDIAGYVFNDSQDEGELVWRVVKSVNIHIGRPTRPSFDLSGTFVMPATNPCGWHVDDWSTGINDFSHILSKERFETDAVLRVSLGTFIFFIIFAFINIRVNTQNYIRDGWHHGGWIVKMIIWALLLVLMFFLPNPLISVYETLSKFGSGFFLLVQVIILLDFTRTWNNAWLAKGEKFWYVALLVVSLVCYVVTFAFSGLLFHWFNPSDHVCSLNVFFIVMTLILAVAFAVISLHPKINGSLLSASVISVYCAYLCFNGLSSEPRDYECNGLRNRSKTVSTGILILGLITTILSVVYSAVRAGSSTTFLSLSSSPRTGSKKPLRKSKDEEGGQKVENKEEARPDTYSYTFFHLIFALASMYSAMLLIGWTSSSGWPSVSVWICTEWITAGLYVWSLVAPLFFPDQELA